MHLPLTERLTCPRCGPGFALVLLADRVEERRVLDGVLGCPNCRDRYPVESGFADLRAPPRRPLPEPDASTSEPDGDLAMRLAALLGVAEGPANVALVGPVTAHAGALAELIPELEVVALSARLRGSAERPGVSRMVSAPGLPFRPLTLEGVALSGEGSVDLLEEAARVVTPFSRVVVLDASEEVEAALRALGLRVRVRQGDILVAERLGPRSASGGVRLPVV
jgi:uncharacterized protein YbaR (Trm112 family)